MQSNKWSSLISRAEKLLGGPAPFIDLGTLLTSETGFLVSRARRLAASVDHPLFGAVRACLHGKPMKYPTFPLSSKVMSATHPPQSKPRASGSLFILLVGQSQSGVAASSAKLCGQHRKLAEIFETIQFAITIHKSIIDPDTLRNSSTGYHSEVRNQMLNDPSVLQQLETGNKIATLAGDVLLASVSSTLASFRNPKVVDIVSESIGNMCQAEFLPLALYCTHGHPWNVQDDDVTATEEDATTTEPEADGAYRHWMDYVSLSRGSLMGTCCQSTMMLSNATTPSVNTEKDSGLAYRLGFQWARMTRLLDERELLRRCLLHETQPITLSTSSNPTFRGLGHMSLGYTENGLSEPTLADAMFVMDTPDNTKQHTSDPLFMDSSTIERILTEYNGLAGRLSDELLDAFCQFRKHVHVSTERASCSALDVISEMMDALADEACSQ